MTTRNARPIPLGLTVLIAFFSALAALAVSNGHDAHAHGNEQHATPVRATAAAHEGATITRRELALRNELRRLWEDHVTWTRLAVVSLVAGSPDTDATVARLLRNQADIGNAVKPFYGRAAGNALTLELRRHILIAADLIAAAKAGDQARLAAEQERWHRNSDHIARLLSSVNPRNWKRAALLAMLDEHLRLTTQEAIARLQGNWTADVAAYDRVHRHALTMADALSAGLVAQFPKRFR
jgi:hypothetical protein